MLSVRLLPRGKTQRETSAWETEKQRFLPQDQRLKQLCQRNLRDVGVSSKALAGYLTSTGTLTVPSCPLRLSSTANLTRYEPTG
jgi:hypothetical protein